MKYVITMSSLFGTALVVFLGCSDASTIAPDASTIAPDAPSGDKPSVEDCDGEKSRGPSESCCPSFGVDACGANLFCAAFDGRSQATCYPLGSRKSLEECTDNEQCLSKACSESGKCVSLLGETCEVNVGCSQASSRPGVPTACVEAKCSAVKLEQCAGNDCAFKEGDICAVPSAGIELTCSGPLACAREANSELSRCTAAGVTDGAALYGNCEDDRDCGDGTYDGVCLKGADDQVCGYRKCTGDYDCTAGKTCLTCPISSGSIKACVSSDHVGNKGAKCQ